MSWWSKSDDWTSLIPEEGLSLYLESDRTMSRLAVYQGHSIASTMLQAFMAFFKHLNVIPTASIKEFKIVIASVFICYNGVRQFT